MDNFIKHYFILSRLAILLFGIALITRHLKYKKKYKRTKFILEVVGNIICSFILLEVIIFGKVTMLFGMFLYQSSEDLVRKVTDFISKNEIRKENKYSSFKIIMHNFSIIDSSLERKKKELEELSKIPQTELNGIKAKNIKNDLIFIDEKIKTKHEDIRRLMKHEEFRIKELLYCSERYNEEVNKNNPAKEE